MAMTTTKTPDKCGLTEKGPRTRASLVNAQRQQTSRPLLNLATLADSRQVPKEEKKPTSMQRKVSRPSDIEHPPTTPFPIQQAKSCAPSATVTACSRTRQSSPCSISLTRGAGPIKQKAARFLEATIGWVPQTRGQRCGTARSVQAAGLPGLGPAWGKGAWQKA